MSKIVYNYNARIFVPDMENQGNYDLSGTAIIASDVDDPEQEIIEVVRKRIGSSGISRLNFSAVGVIQ